MHAQSNQPEPSLDPSRSNASYIFTPTFTVDNATLTRRLDAFYSHSAADRSSGLTFDIVIAQFSYLASPSVHYFAVLQEDPCVYGLQA